MKLSFIAWLISKGLLTPAHGRALEALIVATVATAAAAGLSFLAEWSGSGSFSDAMKTAVTLALLAGGQYLTKTLRDDAKKALEAAAQKARDEANAAR